MADTYSQLYIHIVFSVRGRRPLIRKGIKEKLHQYIGGIIKNEGQVPIMINSMPDHIHILVSIRPSCSISNLVNIIKSNSTRFFKESEYKDNRFTWQNGYGAFSVSPDMVPTITRYIENQESHHRNKSFKEEYIDLLIDSGVEYSSKHAFED